MNREEELEEWTRKYSLLEADRKAFYEQTQLQMKQNKEMTERLKRENKELKLQQAALQNGGTPALAANLCATATLDGTSKTSAFTLSLQEKEVELLTAKVNMQKKQYDELKFEVAKRQREVKDMTDKLRDLEKEAAPILEEDSPLTRQIRILENRLDKAMIKNNEAQSIRKTYEQIVKRLNEERIGFDNQLQAIERTLKAKQHDFLELQNMCHDAIHAKEVAKAELAHFRHQYEENKKAREKELADRRQYVQARIEMTNRLEKRENLRKKLELEAKGDLDAQGEKKLMAAPFAQTFQIKGQEHAMDEDARRVQAHEEAMRRIKEATGVSDINEVIQKYLTQEDTHANLIQMTNEAQAKIDSLNKQKAALKAQIEEIKYAGGGGGSGNNALGAMMGSRRIIDEFEKHLADKAAACLRERAKYERIAKILTDVKAGVEHLADMVADVNIAGCGGVTSIKVNDDTVVDVLAMTEQRLLKIMEAIHAAVGTSDQPPIDGSHAVVTSSVDSLGSVRSSTTTTTNNGGLDLSSSVLLRASLENNIRIKLDKVDDEYETDSEEEEEEGDVLDRETVKKLANIAVEKNTKKNKRKTKKSQKQMGN